MAMSNIVDRRFREWVRAKDPLEARIAIFNSIRDIPYAIVPGLNDAERYADILKLNRGSCTPKHFLLCSMYQRLGLNVLFVVYPFRWDEFEELYPPYLRKPARTMPVSHHLACRVDINGKFILVDATLDPALAKVGMPVNRDWNGTTETLLAVTPSGEEQLFHPSEARFMQPRNDDEKALAFYNKLNTWLDKLRQ